MPKEDKKFQKEVGLPQDSKLIDRGSEYPTILFTHSKHGTSEGVKSADSIAPVKFHDLYDEKRELSEVNLHDKFVKLGTIEKSSGNF